MINRNPKPQTSNLKTLTADRQAHYVVLAGGDYPTHIVPTTLLRHPRVVCCDGAAAQFIARDGRQPYATIGDGDSLPHHLHQTLNLVHIADQETNDLTKAITYLHQLNTQHTTLNTQKVAIVGATGKREDHTLANIALLIDYMRMGLDVAMYTDHGVFLPCHGTRTVCADTLWWLPLLGRQQLMGMQVSIFNFNCQRLSAHGLRYPVYTFASLWQGTLNQVDSTSFTVDADADYLLYLSFTFD